MFRFTRLHLGHERQRRFCRERLAGPARPQFQLRLPSWWLASKAAAGPLPQQLDRLPFLLGSLESLRGQKHRTEGRWILGFRLGFVEFLQGGQRLRTYQWVLARKAAREIGQGTGRWFV